MLIPSAACHALVALTRVEFPLSTTVYHRFLFASVPFSLVIFCVTTWVSPAVQRTKLISYNTQLGLPSHQWGKGKWPDLGKKLELLWDSLLKSTELWKKNDLGSFHRDLCWYTVAWSLDKIATIIPNYLPTSMCSSVLFSYCICSIYIPDCQLQCLLRETKLWRVMKYFGEEQRGKTHIKKIHINKPYSHTDSLIHTNMDLVSLTEKEMLVLCL